MEELLKEISNLIVRGRIDAQAPYPPDMAGQPGVKERVEEALAQGLEPTGIVREGLIPGMEIVGKKFNDGEYFLPDMLMSAQAMKGGMAILEPLLAGEKSDTRGMVILGTVKGDMHDIGKNLVGVMLEGGGFKVYDLGIDVPVEKFVEMAAQHPDAVVGMSALLTTTRENMRKVAEAIRQKGLENKIIIGGAAVGRAFANDIRADGFSHNATEVVPMVTNLLGNQG